MTINRRGISPLLQLHPKTTLCLWGKSGDPSLRSGRPNYGRLERGRSPRSNICHPEPALIEVSSFQSRRWKDPSRTPPET